MPQVRHRENLDGMDELDRALRNATYALMVSLGRAPTANEVATSTGRGRAEVVSGWRRLHEAHALVLNAATDELRMLNPFSAVPSAFRVKAAGRWWYANCAWDAFGVCAALHEDGDIATSCPDCLEPIDIDVRAQRAAPADLLFHCLVPAAHWWDDIVFT
ncbi:MAG: hypothetical protein NVSMB13_02280 [Mycobacteriales bacterium]